MKVVVLEKRRGFVGFVLRKVYGIRKVQDI